MTLTRFLCSALLVLGHASAAEAPLPGAGYRKPIDLRLLILATDGKEAGLAALREFLEYSGTPFDIVRLAAGEPLPALTDGDRGRYQGVIVTLGNLGVCDPNCHSALNPEGWARLDAYTRDFGVRTLSYYTFPESRYGLAYTAGTATSPEKPLPVAFTPEAEPVFRDLRTSASFEIAHAYAYLARLAEPLPGERTIPLLRSAEGDVLAAIHQKADGREYLALTFDNNPSLFHSLLLHGGLIDWLTRGVRLGWRKAWLLPQVDDMFLANYLFDASEPACALGGGTEVAAGADAVCAKLRIDSGDLHAVAAWQESWRAQPQFAALKIALAYNGFGVKTPDDPLLASARELRGSFFWVSHTFSHRHLDCYAASEAGCRGATAEEGRIEVANNRLAAAAFGLDIDTASLVTPQITGLANAEFLKGAAAEGIRYLVSDQSRPDFRPARPNTIVPSPHVPGVLYIARRPTALFYNAADAEPRRPGSEPDEYNFLFGPNGQFRRGDGTPFYEAEQSYSEIVLRDRDLTLAYMLRGEMYPLMFHQANLWRYQGSRTLMTDLLEAVLEKYASLSRLPVVSVSQSRIGQLLEERLGYWKSGVTATLTPGSHVTVTAQQPAVVPLTGVCQMRCEAYGPYPGLTSVAVPAGTRREFRLATPE